MGEAAEDGVCELQAGVGAGVVGGDEDVDEDEDDDEDELEPGRARALHAARECDGGRGEAIVRGKDEAQAAGQSGRKPPGAPNAKLKE